MKNLEIGRVCIKTFGSETGKKCVVVDKIDKNFVVIAGLDVKRRRCNVKHIDVLPKKLSLNKNTTSNEVLEAMVAAGLVEKFKKKESDQTSKS